MTTIRVMETQDKPATEAQISRIKEAARRRAQYLSWLAWKLNCPGGEAFMPYAAEELGKMAAQMVGE